MSDNEEEQVDLEEEEEEEEQYMEEEEEDEDSDHSDHSEQEPSPNGEPDRNANAGEEEKRNGEDEEGKAEEGKGGEFPEDAEERRKWEELTALPPHGAEVFVGGMPREVTEEDLRDLFDPFGDIFEVRLVKDKETKENKGFAFITFTSKDAAQTAIEQVHEKEFKGRTLRCSVSQVKHRLFVGNVPKGLSEEELRKIFEEIGPGVQNVEYFRDQQDPTRNRGFLFVEYYNHSCAEFSRQKLTNSAFTVEGSHLTISWADPKSSLDSAASQVKTLYIKNLPENVDKDKLKEIFEIHGEITKVVLPPGKPGQKRDFGFVHFAERSSALKAVKESEKYEIDGQVLEVSMAKPQTDRNAHKGGGNSQNAPPFRYSEPYGAYGGGGGGGRGSGGFNQPMIYGRGPMPQGMRMVPMVLPDGRLGYVLQQPDGPSSYGGRGRGRRGEGRGGGRRYQPY